MCWREHDVLVLAGGDSGHRTCSSVSLGQTGPGCLKYHHAQSPAPETWTGVEHAYKVLREKLVREEPVILGHDRKTM
jgi:dihydroxyacetone kinase